LVPSQGQRPAEAAGRAHGTGLRAARCGRRRCRRERAAERGRQPDRAADEPGRAGHLSRSPRRRPRGRLPQTHHARRQAVMTELLNVIAAETFKVLRKRRLYILAALYWVVLPVLALIVGRLLATNLRDSFANEGGSV